MAGGVGAWRRGGISIIRMVTIAWAPLALALLAAASLTVPCCAVTRETQALASMAAQWHAGDALASWQVDDVCGAPAGATGVTCQDGSVTALSLSASGLSGPLPAELGSLSALTLLDLSYNKLTGSMLNSISNLTRLHTFDLHANKLNGSLPDSLSALKSLQKL
ncbi:hypothetical protein CLOM_g16665, partial [Closterium sp. NIES-68]